MTTETVLAAIMWTVGAMTFLIVCVNVAYDIGKRDGYRAGRAVAEADRIIRNGRTSP